MAEKKTAKTRGEALAKPATRNVKTAAKPALPERKPKTKRGKTASAALIPRVPEAKSRPPVQSGAQMQEVVVIPLGGNLRRVLFWFGIMLFFCLFFFVFSDVLLPFVAGFVLAYFLNPIVEFSEKIGISRLWATVIIVLIAAIMLVTALVFLVPVLSQQLVGIVKNMPAYFKSLQNIFNTIDAKWLRHYLGIDVSNLQNDLNSVLGQAANLLKTILPSLWDSGKAVMNMVTLVIVTPVVAFYLLLDWDRMVRKLVSWVPRNRLETVRGIVKQMNRAVADFIRGQGTVCLLLACYYAIMLTLCGVNFSLLIGLFIGLIAFIPYIGSTIGLFLSVGMACLQYWPDKWPWIAAVVSVFMVGQFVEGYILQPKLVGSSVGLHPVWLMFALFAFGSLFGFTGMLIAVPAAAAVGVLVRFALNSYLGSVFYEGDGALAETEREKEG